MWLFFGCRNESQDWIFRSEMEGFLAKGTLAKLSTAFSRDASEKVYVQVRNISGVWPSVLFYFFIVVGCLAFAVYLRFIPRYIRRFPIDVQEVHSVFRRLVQSICEGIHSTLKKFIQRDNNNTRGISFLPYIAVY